MKDLKVGDRVTVRDPKGKDAREGWEGIVVRDPYPQKTGRYSTLFVDFGEGGTQSVYIVKLVAGGASEFIKEDWS